MSKPYHGHHTVEAGSEAVFQYERLEQALDCGVAQMALTNWQTLKMLSAVRMAVKMPFAAPTLCTPSQVDTDMAG